ncbi:hypothetical protein [Eubacterium aggregans]|uniref:hypothetical protein n=1 Tax=Eubacterium aggregans TaxID=81409 RepID=UPI003F346102
MESDYVWEGSYGNRTSLKVILKAISKEQDSSSLQMLAAFVNKNPYNLEFLLQLAMIYQKNHVDNMIAECRQSQRNPAFFYKIKEERISIW